MPLLVVALLLLLVHDAGAAEPSDWTRPVAGEVVEAFAYDRGAPYARGGHRGVDLAARPGEPVRAPCAGVVTFAGRMPAQGAGVSIRCGALVATLVELGDASARRGARVGRGDVVGRAAGPVHLGARRAGDALGYVDPIPLLGAPRAPLGPAPGTRGPRPALPAPRRLAATPRESSPPQTTPVAAWVGLALIVLGVPVGALVRRRRARRLSIASPRRWPSM